MFIIFVYILCKFWGVVTYKTVSTYTYLAAGLNAKFTFTCDAEPVTRGIGSGGVMHTNQIKPVHAVRTDSALRHGALFD